MEYGTHVNTTVSGGKRTRVRKLLRYIRISAGPCRNEYVHRLVASALLRRPLQPHETVDHEDQDPTNCHPANLQVLSWKDHGKVTSARKSRGKLAGLEGVDYTVVMRGRDVFQGKWADGEDDTGESTKN